MQKIMYVLGSFTSDAEVKVGFAHVLIDKVIKNYIVYIN